MLRRIDEFFDDHNISLQSKGGSRPLLKAGTIVNVFGLTSESGRLLNGQTGRIISFDGQIGRYGVRLDACKSCKSIKEDKVRVEGTAVEVHGLKAVGAVWINGQTGIIDSFDSETARYVVRLDHDGSHKKVKECNLKACQRSTASSTCSSQMVPQSLSQSPHAPWSSHAVAGVSPSEIAAPSPAPEGRCHRAVRVAHMSSVSPSAIDDVSAALEASLREADARSVSVNAQLGEAILRSQDVPAVHLLEYQRVPAPFENALFACEELRTCIADLQARGFFVRLDSGVKLFVEPELYEAAIAALEPHKGELRSRHIVASEKYVGIVRATLAKIPRKEKVKEKSSSSLTCRQVAREMPPAKVGEADAAQALDEQEAFPVLVKNTFLHITVPSSLLSELSGKAQSSPA